MPTRDGPAPYVDIVCCFVPDPELLGLVRAVAVQACDPHPEYADRVRDVTHALVRGLLPFAHQDSRMRCLFRVLDGEVRLQVVVPQPEVSSPKAKARNAAVLDQLDVYVSLYTTRSNANGTDLVCDTVIPRCPTP